MNYGFSYTKKTMILRARKILFYEMNGKFQWDNVKYYRHETSMRRAATGEPIGPHALGYGANRIWSWNPTTDEVKYIKNRQTGQ